MLFGVKDEDQTDLVSSKVIKNDMALEQNTSLTSFFIKSQFNYCPLICMFCLKKSLHRLNKIHERSLYLNIRKWIVLGQSKKCIKQT